MTKEEETPKMSLQTGEEVRIVEISAKQPADRRYEVREGLRLIGSFGKKSDAEAAATRLTSG